MTRFLFTIIAIVSFNSFVIAEKYHYEYALEVVSKNGKVIKRSERNDIEITVSKLSSNKYTFLIRNYSTHEKRTIECEELSNNGIRTFKTDDGTILTTTKSPNKMVMGLGGSILINSPQGIIEYMLHVPNPHLIDFTTRYKEELPSKEKIYVDGEIHKLKEFENHYGKLISSSRSGEHWVRTYKRRGKFYTVYSSGVVEQH